MSTPMSSHRLTASRMFSYLVECCGCSCTPMRIGKVTPPTLAELSPGEDAPQDVDQHERLVALDGMPGIGDDVHAAKSRGEAGQLVGILVGHEHRTGAAHQRGRRREAGDVVPQSLEAVGRADTVVAPGPGAVVEPLRVVEHPAP